MRRRPRDDHQRALPDRLGPEGPRVVLGRDGLVRVHTGDLHVAARGDRLEADLGLPAHPRPELGPEPHEELGHLDPERPRDGEVRRLVDHDHQDQGEEEGTDAERRHRDRPSYRASMISAARRRAQESARSRFTTETTLEGASCSSTTAVTTSTMRVRGILPSRKAMTATSLAALMTAGKVRASSPTR